MSVCPPPVWACHPPQTVWQSNGLAIPGVSGLSDNLIFPVSCAESSLGCESPDPFSITRLRSSWQGVRAAAAINTKGMRSLERRRLLLHANSLGHHVPRYIQKRCLILPLTRAVHAVQFQHPQSHGNLFFFFCIKVSSISTAKAIFPPACIAIYYWGVDGVPCHLLHFPWSD